MGPSLHLFTAAFLTGMALQITACTDLPKSPNLDEVQTKFDSPTGSIISSLPAELAGLFNATQSETQPLQTPSESSVGAVSESLAKLDIPVDGYVRITRKCDGVANTQGSAGELRATIRITSSVALSTFSAEAKKCRGDFGIPSEIDGTLDVSLEFAPWALISFAGSVTPIADGVVDASKKKQTAAALRFCTSAKEGTCSLGDVELSVDLSAGKNVVFIVSASKKVAGVRDKDGTWSCQADVADPTASSCTLANNSITIPGVNP
jgi:hypothetical protein